MITCSQKNIMLHVSKWAANVVVLKLLVWMVTQVGVMLNAERQLLNNQKFFLAYEKLFTLGHILYIKHIRLKKTNFDVFTVKIGTLLQPMNSRGDWNMQAISHNIPRTLGTFALMATQKHANQCCQIVYFWFEFVSKNSLGGLWNFPLMKNTVEKC